MVITPHAVVGSLIAVVIVRLIPKNKDPVWAYLIALPLAFISHFILDAIPHWEYNYRDIRNSVLLSRALADSIIAISLIMVASRGLEDGFIGFWKRRLIFIGAFAAILPDILTLIKNNSVFMQPYLSGFEIFHERIHTRTRILFLTGFSVEVMVTFLSFFLIFLLTRNINNNRA